MGILETKIAEFVGNHSRRWGYPPTVEELVSTFGFINIMKSMFYVFNLFRIGMIRNSLFFGTSDLRLISVKTK